MQTTETKTTAPVVMVREGTMFRQAWRQFMVIRDASLTLVEMKPASIGGWNVERVSVQGSKDWPKYTRDQIVAWKLANDANARIVTAAEVGESFFSKLLSL